MAAGEALESDNQSPATHALGQMPKASMGSCPTTSESVYDRVGIKLTAYSVTNQKIHPCPIQGFTMAGTRTREERDSMGVVAVPADAYWGAQTQRAAENFPISGYRFGRRFIRALGLIKRAAAAVNRDLGKLDPALAGHIEAAATEVIDGKLDDHFILDVFQTVRAPAPT